MSIWYHIYAHVNNTNKLYFLMIYGKDPVHKQQKHSKPLNMNENYVFIAHLNKHKKKQQENKK